MSKPTRLQFLRRFTTTLFNPISRRFAAWLPGFGILVYRGRTSGRAYRTPMNVFRRGNTYFLALTYGPDVQWVKNVVAAGGCELVTGGRRIRLGSPRVFSDPGRRLMPTPVRQFLGLMRVTEFMELQIEPAAPATS